MTEKNESKDAFYLGEVRLGWVGLGNLTQPFITLLLSIVHFWLGGERLSLYVIYIYIFEPISTTET